MPERDLIIGLDSSTTACKAIVWDMQGREVAVGRASLPLLKPRPGWHEQPADAWWSAAVEAIRAALASVDAGRLAGISISAQRETFVLVDEAMRPLGNALVWMDERARSILPGLQQSYGKERFHQEAGKPLSANLTVSKLAWFGAEQPEVLARAALVLDVHAALAYHLTGQAVTSWGCADPMGLFDMPNNCWNTHLIESIGMRVEQFPAALAVGSLAGRVSTGAAGETGLPEGLALFAGLGDGQAAGLGTGITQPGEAYLNLGTAVVSGAISAQYRVDPAFRTHYSGIDGRYALETVLLGGAYTITWFLENFAAGADLPALERAAGNIPPGAQGLTLLPYWNSAMNPYWDASASGAVIGWRGAHTPAHLYRAILEGIALEQRLATSGVEAALGKPIERFSAVGGGSRSDLWCQIIADVTGKLVVRADAPEASALGAGMVAAAGAGLYPGLIEAVRGMAKTKDALRAAESAPFAPDGERRAFYSRLYEEVYKPLYPAVREIMGRLEEISGEEEGG